MLTVGSLFSGIGGFDLGLERAGMRVEWQVENNDYCREVLKKHWPKVPCHYDITKIDWEWMPRVDLVCGGPPCQPVSLAGKRRGASDDRHLWGEVIRCLDTIKPTYTLFENVPGIISLGLDDVLTDLENLGYETGTVCVPACAVDAPHIRQRVWIVAHAKCKGSQRQRKEYGLRQDQKEVQARRGGRWSREPGIQRVADGVSDRIHRLKALGNAVVPQIVEALGRMILAADCDPKMSQPCQNATGSGGDSRGQ